MPTTNSTITLQISIVPIPETKDKHEISLTIQSEQPPTYNTIINTLIALVDDLITKAQNESNKETGVQLEESTTTTA